MAGRAAEPALQRALEAAFAAGLPRAGGGVSRIPRIPRILSVDPLSGGSINRAYRLATSEGTFFCKWNPGGPQDLFEREREGLEALASAESGLVIPGAVALSPAGEGDPVLVLEWLAPAAPGKVAWEALGRGLAVLHRKTAESFGFARDNHCGLTPQANGWMDDWAAFWGERRLAPLLDRLEAAGRAGAKDLAVFRKLRDRLPGLLGHGPIPSLIHGDLWSGNFLASDKGPALVDPAVYHGDREAEWAMMLLFGGFPDAVLAAYQESWPLPAGWRERTPLYQLYHVLNHFLLFGGGYGEQAARSAARYL